MAEVTTFVELSLDSIDIPDNRARDYDPAWGDALAKVIDVQGLLNPVTVRQIGPNRYELAAGLHRFRAHEILHKTAIWARVSDEMADDEARLVELMENLGRHELIALDRCHHLYELKKVWERMYPETGHGKASSKSQSLALSDGEQVQVFGFAKATSEKIGLSLSSIKAAVKIWKGLSVASRARVVGTDLARKQTELKALSEQTHARQDKILDLIFDDTRADVGNVAGAIDAIDGGVKADAFQKRYQALCESFRSLPDESFDTLVLENEARVIAALKRQGRL